MLADLSGDAAINVMKAAVYAGAGILADAVKREIDNLPEQSGYMRNGQRRNVIGKHNKRMLKERLGISRITATGDKADAVVSFDGYNDRPTKKYPSGVPIAMLARSIESGSSVRQKNPFIRRAYNSARTQAQEVAIDAGQKAINDIIK